jgi:hypothetical protein
MKLFSSVLLGIASSGHLVDSAELLDLPNELLIKISSMAGPSKLAEVNRRLASLPVPCEHYPTLVKSVLKLYRKRPLMRDMNMSDNPIVLKATSVIQQHEYPLECFPNDTFEQLGALNATDTLHALWERKDDVLRRHGTDGLMSWMGNGALLYSLLHGDNVIFQGIESVGLFDHFSSHLLDLPSTLETVRKSHFYAFGILYQDLYAPTLEHVRRTPVPIDDIAIVLAVMGGNAEIVRGLIERHSKQFTSYSFQVAVQFKHIHVAAMLYNKGQMQFEDEHVQLAVENALREDNVQGMQFLASLMTREQQKAIIENNIGRHSLFSLKQVADLLPTQDVADILSKHFPRSFKVVAQFVSDFAESRAWSQALLLDVLQSALKYHEESEQFPEKFHFNTASKLVEMYPELQKFNKDLLQFHPPQNVQDPQSGVQSVMDWTMRVRWLQTKSKAKELPVITQTEDSFTSSTQRGASCLDPSSGLNVLKYICEHHTHFHATQFNLAFQAAMSMQPTLNMDLLTICLKSSIPQDYIFLLFDFGMLPTEEYINSLKQDNPDLVHSLAHILKVFEKRGHSSKTPKPAPCSVM